MTGKPITFGRYQKVEAFLEADRALKDKLGAKTEIVLRPPPSNEKAYFSKPVVYITEMLHEHGADAHTTSKSDVLRLALKLLQEGDGEFKIPETLLRPAPEPPQAAVSKPNRPKADKPKADKPKAAVAVKPVVQKSGSGLAKAPPSRKPVEVKKEGKVSPKSEPVAEQSTSAAGEQSAPVKAVMDPTFPLAYGVSIVTLLYAVDQIAEAHDRSPGRKERQQKVADLIREYQSLTHIPKGAKETGTSTA
jgi:hypothetical protein